MLGLRRPVTPIVQVHRVALDDTDTLMDLPKIKTLIDFVGRTNVLETHGDGESMCADVQNRTSNRDWQQYESMGIAPDRSGQVDPSCRHIGHFRSCPDFGVCIRFAGTTFILSGAGDVVEEGQASSSSGSKSSLRIDAHALADHLSDGG